MMTNYPKRIISLVPSKTELLYDLGLNKEIVGITKFCIHPKEQVKAVEKIGGTKQLHLEKIAALEPDLIIANKEENTKEQIEWLAQRFPLYLSDIQTINDALEMIERVGDLVGKSESATQWVKSIEHEREVFRCAKGSAGTACYLIWKNPYLGVGANTYIHSMLTEGGWDNVLADDYERYPELELSEIIAAEPQYVFLSSEPFPFKEKHIKELKEALPHTTIKLVDGELFSWYGSRMKFAFSYFDFLRSSSP